MAAVSVLEGARARVLAAKPTNLEAVKVAALRDVVLAEPYLSGPTVVLRAIRSAQFDAALAGFRRGAVAGALLAGVVAAAVWAVLR